MTIHELIECLKLYPNQNTEIKSIHINNNEITLRKENDGCTKNQEQEKNAEHQTV